MKINDFSVTVKTGEEVWGGYVKMQHGRQYNIRLNNDKPRRCDAKVVVDGKEVGIFRLGAYGSMVLERPANDTGRFTFYAVGTPEAQRAGITAGNDLNGLIQVTFTPEKKQVVRERGDVHAAYPTMDSARPEAASRSYRPPASFGGDFGAGATGLSGKSNQEFVTVGEIDYDLSEQTTISLRLVAGKDEPRPLVSVSHANAVPASVERT